MRKIKIENTCWVWQGAINKGTGYAYSSWNGKSCSAHRLAYRLFKGEIPEGLVIDHLCNNKICMNPEHLEAVTQKENMIRGGFLGQHNSIKTKCPRGHSYNATRSYNGCKQRVCTVCNSYFDNLETNGFDRKTFTNTELKDNSDIFNSLNNNAQGNLMMAETFLNELILRLGNKLTYQVIRLELFKRGIVVYGKSTTYALRYFIRSQKIKNITIEDIALAAGLLPTKTKLRKKLDGILIEN